MWVNGVRWYTSLLSLWVPPVPPMHPAVPCTCILYLVPTTNISGIRKVGKFAPANKKWLLCICNFEIASGCMTMRVMASSFGDALHIIFLPPPSPLARSQPKEWNVNFCARLPHVRAIDVFHAKWNENDFRFHRRIAIRLHAMIHYASHNFTRQLQRNPKPVIDTRHRDTRMRSETPIIVDIHISNESFQ